MRNYKKIRTVLGLLFVVMIAFLTLPTNADAATMGGKLTNPETGWKRYDDTNKSIKYIGEWVTFKDGIDLYGGSIQQTKSIDAYISFTFKGTQLRILSDNWDTKTKKAEISINGNVEYFSENSKTAGQTLVYEKKGLSNLVVNHVIIRLVSADGLLNLDAIDINEGGMLISDDAVIHLQATGYNSSVGLKWNQIKDADSYIVRYGTGSGTYIETLVTSKEAYENFVIPELTNGTKYFFLVIPVVNGEEIGYSNEADAIPQEPVIEPEQPSGDRAILVVTMTTGLEKEYDLSMLEVNDFINWYEAKQEGTGKASYAINKHDNNKGPFKSRKDYILFDRILTFEISEY